MIDAVRARTGHRFNVNLFVHATAKADEAREQGWLQALQPLFERYGAEPPTTLRTIYRSFADDGDMLAMLVEAKPPVVSFHFGLPRGDQIAALKEAGCVLVASATSVAELRAVEAAEVDMVVAQGWEAGGHRGVFDPMSHDDRLGTMALVRLLVTQSALPVIAAGGDHGWCRDPGGPRSGSRRRATGNRLHRLPGKQRGRGLPRRPAWPWCKPYRDDTRDFGSPRTLLGEPVHGVGGERSGGDARISDRLRRRQALHAAAKAAGEGGFGAQWAGQGAPLSRSMPAADLVALLWREATGTS